MNKVVPDPPFDPAKDRAAFNRAIDHYLPTQGFHSVNEDLSFEDALLYTASLLDSASATALDCGEQLESPERAKILAVWHLLEIAKTTVDRSINCQAQFKCGSWFACDSGGSASIFSDWHAAIAGKPAPTFFNRVSGS